MACRVFRNASTAPASGRGRQCGDLRQRRFDSCLSLFRIHRDSLGNDNIEIGDADMEQTHGLYLSLGENDGRLKRESTIDHDDLARNVASFGRSKKCDKLRHLRGLSHPP